MAQPNPKLSLSKPVWTGIVVLSAVLLISYLALVVFVWAHVITGYSHINEEIAAFGSEDILSLKTSDEITPSATEQGEKQFESLDLLTCYSFSEFSAKLPALWLTVWSSGHEDVEDLYRDKGLQSLLRLLISTPGEYGVDYELLLTPTGTDAACKRGLPKEDAPSQSYPKRLSELIHPEDVLVIVVTSSSGTDIFSSTKSISAKLHDIDVMFEKDYSYRKP